MLQCLNGNCWLGTVGLQEKNFDYRSAVSYSVDNRLQLALLKWYMQYFSITGGPEGTAGLICRVSLATWQVCSTNLCCLQPVVSEWYMKYCSLTRGPVGTDGLIGRGS